GAATYMGCIVAVVLSRDGGDDIRGERVKSSRVAAPTDGKPARITGGPEHALERIWDLGTLRCASGRGRQPQAMTEGVDEDLKRVLRRWGIPSGLIALVLLVAFLEQIHLGPSSAFTAIAHLHWRRLKLPPAERA